MVVHPDSPLEIAFAFLQLLGRGVKNVSLQVIFLLRSLIDDVVLRQFVRAYREMQAAFNVVLIFRADRN